jgi:hypothetical protein
MLFVENRIYTPTEYLDPSVTKPVLFLAGPIQGAPDWQAEAISIIRKTRANLIIASPRRPEELEANFVYDEQVEWETEHMERAWSNGAVMFWCPKESHKIDGRAYAQTTRAEYGRSIENHRHTGSKMTLGMEQGFSGAKYFRFLAGKYYPQMQIADNLLETCLNAVELARKMK